MADNKKFNKNKTQQPTGGLTEEGFLRISLVNQGVFIKRKKVCPLKDISIQEINYKNLTLLNKFLTERGRIIPSRVTNVSMKKQRALTDAIKMARHLALLSPIAKDSTTN